MSAGRAHERLATAMTGAVLDVLRRSAGPSAVGTGAASRAPDVQRPLAEVALPAVMLEAAWAPPLAGGVALALPVEAARRLSHGAAGVDLDALALLARSCGRVAADAAARVADTPVALGVPRTRVVHGPEEAAAGLPAQAHVIAARLELWGVPCVLLLLVPEALVEGLARDALRSVPVKVWAELGRVRMTRTELADLPDGHLVELDQEVEAPVGLCVGDAVVGRGRLVVLDDGELALRVDEVALPDAVS